MNGFGWLLLVCLLFIIITMIGLQKTILKQQIQCDEITQNVGKMTGDRFQPKQYEVCITPSLTNIAFVKVHKAGSTTVMNILQRFANQHNLSLALPNRGHILANNLDNVMHTSRDNRYNMLINHVFHYDRAAFQRVLYPDTKYIGIVREPLDLTVSAFQYYKSNWGIKMYKNIHGENPLQEYLKNREMYESGVDAYHSYTNNRMSFDFGLPQCDFRNFSVIQTFIRTIDSEFDLVMIMEYFVESVIFLRRLLCWSIKDVLFIKRNTNSKKHQIDFTEAERDYHRNFSMADNLLYDHFVDKFKHQLRYQDDEFFEEVDILWDLLYKVTHFCDTMSASRFEPNHKTLHISQSQFSSAFNVSAHDCHLMLISELEFVEKTRARQYISASVIG